MHSITQNLRLTVHNLPLQAQDSDIPQVFGFYFQHDDLPFGSSLFLSVLPPRSLRLAVEERSNTPTAEAPRTQSWRREFQTAPYSPDSVNANPLVRFHFS